MRKTLMPVVAGALLAAAVVGLAGPAQAVTISKTNWADGDPAAAKVPSRTPSPSPDDTTGDKRFDKAHDTGTFAR